MKHASIRYLTKEGFRNIWSNRLMSLASVSVLSACLVLLGCSFMLFANTDAVLGRIEAQNVIMVFAKDDATDAELDELKNAIDSTPNVAYSEFIPKEQAYQELLESLGEDASLLEGLGNDILPDAFRVTVSDMNQYDNTVEALSSLDNILRIRRNSDLATRLIGMRTSIVYIGAGIIIMLLFVALFIIANTVRITMFTRRLEISIMKAVGATNSFIRWPFMVEGILLGIISASLSVGLVFLIYRLAATHIQNLIGILGATLVPFGEYAVMLYLGFLAVGILTGFFGSLVSLGKYLREQGSVVKDE
ncbi:MAG TPA: permease-like cell division protein FtsX [Clostridiales bacterium]|nr:permease-like cell division protein FtsX [Clostridiales bacterium]